MFPSVNTIGDLSLTAIEATLIASGSPLKALVNITFLTALTLPISFATLWLVSILSVPLILFMLIFLSLNIFWTDAPIEFFPPIRYTSFTFSNLFNVSEGIVSFLVNNIGAFLAPDNPLADNPSDNPFSELISIAIS